MSSFLREDPSLQTAEAIVRDEHPTVLSDLNPAELKYARAFARHEYDNPGTSWKCAGSLAPVDKIKCHQFAAACNMLLAARYRMDDALRTIEPIRKTTPPVEPCVRDGGLLFDICDLNQPDVSSYFLRKSHK